MRDLEAQRELVAQVQLSHELLRVLQVSDGDLDQVVVALERLELVLLVEHVHRAAQAAHAHEALPGNAAEQLPYQVPQQLLLQKGAPLQQEKGGLGRNKLRKLRHEQDLRKLVNLVHKNQLGAVVLHIRLRKHSNHTRIPLQLINLKLNGF